MKKLLSLFLGLIITISGFSQNYFETFIRSDDGIKREGKYVVETPGHGYVISFNVKVGSDIYNEMLASLSSEGEVLKQLVFQINGKNLIYCGLFRHPENENEILAVATLYEGNTMNDFIQKEIAFIRFDEDLNIISQTVHDFGDEYVHLSADGIHPQPRLLLDADGTVTMVAHCQKTTGYCNLFARFTAEGELLAQKEFDLTSSGAGHLINCSANMKSDRSFGMILYESNKGGDYYYEVDSAFNLTRIGKLAHLTLRETMNQGVNLVDTTYYYALEGFVENLNDSVTLITSYALFLKHLGGKHGWFHYLASLDDSLNVLNTDIWDIATYDENAPGGIDYQSTRLPARDVAISITDDAIFHCGVMGINDHSHNPSVSSIAPSTITLSKFDKEMNLQWRRYYGGDDNFYDVDVIKATEDGGCIMTGVYNKGISVYALLSYILKVDENGYDAIGENVESIAKPYFCYPNPAKDIVYIEFSPDVDCQSVEIYTLDGRLLKSQNNNFDKINITNLNSGVYLMKVRMSDGSEFTERIVKE